MKNILLSILLVPFFSFGQYKYSKDEHQHFWSGAVISSSLGYVAYRMNVKRPEILGLLIGISAGLLKEIIDHSKHDKSDTQEQYEDHMNDFTLTASGSTVGMFFFVIAIGPPRINNSGVKYLSPIN